MAFYVKATALEKGVLDNLDKSQLEIEELPLEGNDDELANGKGCLPMSTLQESFPNATGLKYRTNESTWRRLRLENGKLHTASNEKWSEDRIYVVTYLKAAAATPVGSGHVMVARSIDEIHIKNRLQSIEIDNEGYLHLTSLQAHFGKDACGLVYQITQKIQNEDITAWKRVPTVTESNGNIKMKRYDEDNWWNTCVYVVRESNEELDRAMQTRQNDALWRKAVLKFPSPREQNPANWILEKTDVPSGSNCEGVPETPCHRAPKLDKTLKMLASKDDAHILITGPPQSGKTAMAQLMLGYIKHIRAQRPKECENLSVHYLTFSGYIDKKYDSSLGLNEEQALERSLNDHFLKFFNMTLDDFGSYIASNPNCIVILDEAQTIYHHKTDFWQRFKPSERGSCSLLAFSAYTSPKSDPTGQEKRIPQYASTPSQLAKTLPYTFLAFDEGEFTTVVNRFVSERNLSNSADKVRRFIKQFVASPEFKNEDGSILPKVFHPGLTYAILRLLSQGDIDNLQMSVGAVYEKLKLYTRCFADYDAIEAGSRLLSEASKTTPTQFWQRVRALLTQLLSDQSISLVDLGLSPLQIDDYRRLLVRYVLCCSGDDNKAVVYMSCELVRHRFRVLAASQDWSDATVYQGESIDDYIKLVVSRFLSSFPNGSRGTDHRLLERAYQDQFLLRANAFSGYKVQTEVPADSINDVMRDEYGKTFETGKKLYGWLDFFINQDLRWGIEITRDSHQLRAHLLRGKPGGKYCSLKCKQYRVLDCVSIIDCFVDGNHVFVNGPDKKEYKCLTQEEASQVIIAVFRTDSETPTVEIQEAHLPDPSVKGAEVEFRKTQIFNLDPFYKWWISNFA